MHWNGPLYDVKISRHLNVHWGQQIALFGPIQVLCGQQHAIGRLVVVCGTKMQNTKSKNCLLKVRLYVLTKNGLLYCYHWVTCSCLFWPLRKPLATQQMSNSSFGYTLLDKKFHRARLNEFKKVGKFVTFERFLSAPNQLQHVLCGPKRTDKHYSYRKMRDCGH